MAYSRGALEIMKMSELREIGNPLGARDSSKSELIDEILSKQPKPKGESDIQKLIDKLVRFEGDIMQTYELRNEILANLGKLKNIEENK